jgi:hypothetical protein
VVTSLLGPLQRLDTPWAELEAELRTAYAALCETGSPIMVCTLLRHVPASEGHEAADRTRLRLRRLDLLVTELSREYGALVIDLDRILADIGARRLETDYRLGGEPVVSFASNAIAISIVSNALDDFVAYEIQNAARTLLERDRPVVGVMTEIKMTNLMTLGSGRRKQFASTVTDSVQENHVGWLVQQVLKGQIGPAEALNRLTQAMRNRGARESAALLIKGVTRLFRQQA